MARIMGVGIVGSVVAALALCGCVEDRQQVGSIENSAGTSSQTTGGALAVGGATAGPGGGSNTGGAPSNGGTTNVLGPSGGAVSTGGSGTDGPQGGASSGGVASDTGGFGGVSPVGGSSSAQTGGTSTAMGGAGVATGGAVIATGGSAGPAAGGASPVGGSANPTGGRATTGGNGSGGHNDVIPGLGANKSWATGGTGTGGTSSTYATAPGSGGAKCVGPREAGWMQCSSSIAPSPRATAMAYDSARGVVVLFGGDGGNSCLSDTWEWNGADWSLRNTPISPSPRAGSNIGYDSTRHVTVLFGGFDSANNYLRDTWEWDGSIWTQRFPLHAPPGGVPAAMVFDSARGVMVLYGGGYDFGFLSSGDFVQNAGDLWEWDGTDWDEQTPTNGPPPRERSAAAYDSERQKMLMFGGLSPAVIPANGGFTVQSYGDTWEWDGSIWAQPTLDGPGARHEAGAVFDSSRGLSVLFGGINYSESSEEILGDTWEWDGAHWVQPQVTPTPVPRCCHAMAYDSARGVTVAFGGIGMGSFLGDTWEYKGN